MATKLSPSETRGDICQTEDVTRATPDGLTGNQCWQEQEKDIPRHTRFHTSELHGLNREP